MIPKSVFVREGTKSGNRIFVTPFFFCTPRKILRLFGRDTRRRQAPLCMASPVIDTIISTKNLAQAKKPCPTTVKMQLWECGWATHQRSRVVTLAVQLAAVVLVSILGSKVGLSSGCTWPSKNWELWTLAWQLAGLAGAGPREPCKTLSSEVLPLQDLHALRKFVGVIGENRGPLRSTGIARLHESISIDPMLTVWEERSVKSCDAYFTVEVVSSFRYKPMTIDIGIRCSRAATENVCCNIHFPGNTYFADSVTSTMYIILLKNRFTGSRTLCDSATVRLRYLTYKNLGWF